MCKDFQLKEGLARLAGSLKSGVVRMKGHCVRRIGGDHKRGWQSDGGSFCTPKAIVRT